MIPQVLKEYTGPGKEGEQDILILLRPQANNCFFESLLLSVFRSSPEYRKTLWLEYLANLPGEFIYKKNLMERHYAYRMNFANEGKNAMTDTMKTRFQEVFQLSVDECEIYGAYDAMIRLDMDEKELFKYDVVEDEKIKFSGQSIVKIKDKNNKDVYVINYDIPALLTFNYKDTNSAVMIFRTTLTYKAFNRIILDVLHRISSALADSNSKTGKGCKAYLSPEDMKLLQGTNIFRHKRLFHYSHGPFEQILDGRDFIYNSKGESVSLEKLTYTNYLLQRGISIEEIDTLINNPIITLTSKKQKEIKWENSLFIHTRNMSYEKGYGIMDHAFPLD